MSNSQAQFQRSNVLIVEVPPQCRKAHWQGGTREADSAMK